MKTRDVAPDVTRAVADAIDKEIHRRLSELRERGEIESMAFYRVSTIVVDVTKDYR